MVADVSCLDGAVLAYLRIDESPLLPGVQPIDIYYREWGTGMPLVILHGGWGYEIYDFRRQVDVFKDRFRVIAPDRTGYGRSQRISELPCEFHRAAAIETFKVMDALGIERAVLWGHSDGAVIAAIMALEAHPRIIGVIMEAFHSDRNKISSKPFFETMASEPENLGERVCSTLARDHGNSYWRDVLRAGGNAWLRIIDQSSDPSKDLYAGRLSELSAPAVFIHGARDPRTEPGELERTQELLPACPMNVIDAGGHSPHTESASVDECNVIARDFLTGLDK
jgi:pimeloyl-ACP methyl ester carboxylesterase